MNLQREAYLMEYQRQLMADTCNNNLNLTRPARRPKSSIGNGLRWIGQIRGIHIHISFDLKEPADQIGRANA